MGRFDRKMLCPKYSSFLGILLGYKLLLLLFLDHNFRGLHRKNPQFSKFWALLNNFRHILLNFINFSEMPNDVIILFDPPAITKSSCFLNQWSRQQHHSLKKYFKIQKNSINCKRNLSIVLHHIPHCVSQ